MTGSEGGNTLSRDLAAQLTKTLDTLRESASLKVLILEGSRGGFARGGRTHYNDALAEGLYRALASFPYPVIAAMQGDAVGPGFLLGALCDFMVCGEAANYRYTHPEEGLFPSAEEDRLFSRRFGRLRAADFLYWSAAASGRQLKEKRWSCPILPAGEVETYAFTMASNLAQKSRDSLRLLKQHLARHLLELAQALTAVEPASGTAPDDAGNGARIAAPGKHLQLEIHADKVLLLKIRNTKKKYETKSLAADLSALFAQLKERPAYRAYRAIVLSSEYRDFLPDAEARLPADALADLRRALLQAPLPVIAVMNPSVAGKAWLAGQFCDAAVYQEEGSHSAAGLLRSPELSGLAASMFAHRFGSEAARNILLTGAPCTGAELRQRFGPVAVAPRDQALSTALKLAEAWAAWPSAAVLSWKQRAVLGIREEIERLPANPAPQPDSGKSSLAAPTPIALASKVIAATAYPEGIVEVTMQDRDSKNMFSEEFIQGMGEVFAHIDATPDYKVVILTGYDKYFASGGTKEALVAIQQGKLKFTEDRTFQLALACKIPVIAAMQGHGIGAGLSLGLFADLPLLSEESKYLSPYMSYGFTPGVGATLIVPERMGLDLARDTLMTAREYDGAELKDRGLPLPVHPRKQMRDAAMRLAKSVAQQSRSGLILAKDHLVRHLRDGLAEICEREVAMHEQTFVGQSDTLKQIETVFQRLESQHEASPGAASAATAAAPTAAASTAATSAPVAAAPVAAAPLVDLSVLPETVSAATPAVASAAALAATSAATSAVTSAAPANASAASAAIAQAAAQAVALPEVVDTLKQLLARELHLEGDELDENTQFTDLGLDSITGVTWMRKVNQKYGLSLDATIVYSYPTLTKLGRHVKEQVENRDTASSVPDFAELEAGKIGLRDAGHGKPAVRAVSLDLIDPLETAAPAAPVALVELSPPAREEAVREGAVRENAPAADMLPEFVATLKRLLARELHLEEDELDENTQFTDLGLDSITGVTWMRKVNEKYGLSLDATIVYSYPTLTKLGRHVQEVTKNRDSSAGMPDFAELETRKLRLQEPERQEPVVPGISLVQVGEPVGQEITRSLRQPLAAPSVETRGDARGEPADEPPPVRELVSWRKTLSKEPAGAADRALGAANAANAAAAGNDQASAPAPGRAPQPIAVIGMAGQFPMAKNLDEYWKNIAEGKNCISEVPSERWDLQTYFQEGEPAEGKTNSKWLGSLEEYDLFDPLFFNISPAEAKAMDPQQRLFLQACWQSIEHAGYNPKSLAGSQCGVFVGGAGNDYGLLSRKMQLSAYGFTGNASSILSARISYFLDLQGPCIAIDTACSSSLVAIAAACDSLTSGASDLALAGGVYVGAGPAMHIMTSQTGMLSTDGRCYTFDHRANGFVPGEAVGVVMLKRLADAERDGDIIHAVVQGWGVNQDGRTNGITAPNPESQARLMQDIYRRHDIDPAEIQLIEAHGTGTALGDPIEIEGLKKSFRAYTRNRDYCALGSVKSNIGHCLTAAGVTAFIKTVLAIKHKQLPPTINFERLNEHIKLQDTPFYVNERLREWELRGASRRQAAVSSFGYSGTNAHVVVAEYAPPQTAKRTAPLAKYLVPLSAKTAEQLKQRARDLLDFIRKEGASTDLAEMAYTLQVGREAMDERLGLVVGSMEQLAEKLQAWVDGQKDIAEAFHGQVRLNKEGISVISQDEELKETIVDNWIAQKKFSKLLKLWAKGLELDWNKLYGENKPRRIVLPTYPFAKERYWIDNPDGSRLGAAAPLHPLVHRNTSTLSRQSYASVFGEPLAREDFLEMARAAVRLASPERHESAVELREVVWEAPPAVAANTEVAIELFALDAESVGFEIASDGAVHCSGQAVFVERPAAAGNAEPESARQLFFEEYWKEQPFVAEATGAAEQRKTVVFADAAMGNPPGDAIVIDDLAVDIQGVIRRVADESGLPVSVIYTRASGRKEAGIHALFELFKAVKACGSLVSEVVLVGRYDPSHLDSAWDYSWIGFERSLKLVLPEVKIALLYTDTPSCGARQLTEARQAGGVSWYRHGKRHVPALRPVESGRATQAAMIKQQGAYLITGGCGALGMKFAHHLARNYHARLVLLGRRPLSADIQAQLDGLRQAGARDVQYAAVDIGNGDALKAWARTLSVPLSGVFHAAGVDVARPFHEKSTADLDAVLRPKTAGTVLLDEALREHPLDFVCYFSSSAGVLGDFGSCDYAIANRFQMAYGHYRRQHGKLPGKTLVINWPFWQKEAGQQGGMGSNDPGQVAFYLKSSGQDALTSADGIRIWEDLLRADRTQTLVMVGQPARIDQFLGRIYRTGQPAQARPDSSMPAPLPAPQHSQAKPSAPRASSAGASSKNLPLPERLRLELRRLVSSSLQIDESRLDDRTNLADYGFDSINLASFAKRLTSHFSLEVTPALFFNHSTVQQLADYFATEHQRHFQEFYGRSQPAEAEAGAAHAGAVHAGAVHTGDARPERAQPLRQAAPRGRFLSAAPAGVPQAMPATAALREPIAVVGMSGRFPQANDVDEFWRLLAEGKSGITEIPRSRWDWSDYFTAPGHIGNVISTNKGGFIDGFDEFDPLFFEISPAEAEEMDPSERLLLMEAYRAIEDARMSPASLRGKNVGVFVGMEESQYSLVTDVQSVTTTGAAMISSRLSYFLDLHGPTIATNTACSSGLVALHQAVASLRQGECESALVAGVALNLSPKAWIKMSEARMLSQDGQCFSFSKNANGIGVGEAIVVLMLKPLSAAVADRDRIYGVIKASGINFDGKTNGVTAPNGRAQAQLIESVYASHGIDIRDVSHIVAHGTGTKLGDPVEINALNDAFKKLGRQQGLDSPGKAHCAITSCKTNFGHTMAASGLVSLAGLLKGIEHRKIPASLYCEEENDYISWRDSHFYINKSTRDWHSDGGKPRMGAVSAFGRSGTNAHVVVEEYRAPVAADRRVNAARGDTAVIVPLSARAAPQLRQKARDLLDFIRREGQADLAAMAYTLQVGREHMEERLALVVSSVEQLAQGLDAYLGARLHAGSFQGSVGHKREAMSVIGLDGDVRETIGQWMAAGELPKLADSWAKGVDLDWEKLYGDAQSRPERIGLPTYPFARERYWIDGPAQEEYQERETASDGRPDDGLESIEDIINKIDEGSIEKHQAAAFLKKMSM